MIKQSGFWLFDKGSVADEQFDKSSEFIKSFPGDVKADFNKFFHGSFGLFTHYRKKDGDSFVFDGDKGVLLAMEGAPRRDGKLIKPKDMLHDYYLNGPKFADLYDGAFFCAIYDSRIEKLFLIRDRVGLKTIYYSVNDKGAVFSSMIGFIVLSDWVPRKPNLDIVRLYATSNYKVIYGRQETFFDNIYLMPARSILSINKNGVVETEIYWDPDGDEEFLKDSEDVIAEEFNRRMLKSIKDCTPKSGYCVALSGGMDSGSLIAMLHELKGKKIDAISITYNEDSPFNEEALVKASVDMHANKWFDVKVSVNELKKDMFSFYDIYQQPLCTISLYMLAKTRECAMKKGYPFIFTGGGADTHMSGTYPSYLYYLAQLKMNGDKDLFERELKFWIENHATEEFPKSREVFEKFFRDNIKIDKKGGINEPKLAFRDNILKKEIQDIPFKITENIPSYGTYLRTYAIHEHMRESTPSTVDAGNTYAWQYDVGSIDPFLDKELLEYSWKIPDNLKIRDGVSKYLVRKIMKGKMPDSIVDRKAKSGLNAPTDIWFRKDLKPILMVIRNSAELVKMNLYNLDVVDKMIKEHMLGEKNHMMFLWQLVNLTLWYKKWIFV